MAAPPTAFPEIGLADVMAAIHQLSQKLNTVRNEVLELMDRTINLERKVTHLQHSFDAEIGPQLK